MRQPVARAIFRANSTARRLSTGSTPGMPKHMAQICVLGNAPKVVAQPQKILLWVRRWACTSNPITASYSMIISKRVVGEENPCPRARESALARETLVDQLRHLFPREKHAPEDGSHTKGAVGG